MKPSRSDRPTVVAGALGECVHVAGVIRFLRLAESAGWRTVFLGPAVPPEVFLESARREGADLVGVSYRLTPETGERLLGSFAEAASELHESGVRFAFGGTPPVAARADRLDFFERTFDGSQPDEIVLAYLKGDLTDSGDSSPPPQTTLERIRWKAPLPLLRHHFGLPDLDSTRTGIERIADAGLLDVISLGVDQDAQENFFHPDRQDPRRRGAGGVPVRTAADYASLYEASRRGNFPLLRTYSGTDDFLALAEMYVETIHIAWCAIPLYWFNRMDGRGPWPLLESIVEHQRVMAWYGERRIPVELNEVHHWGMRDAPDVICVAVAFLAAHNARSAGVRDYIAQLMFNSPPGLTGAMDLAKMWACLRAAQSLSGESFTVWTQTRTGLLSYPVEPEAARSHLATSVYQQMALRPHIVHVVGPTEAHHAATAEDVIEACRLARRAVTTALDGAPDALKDPAVVDRVEELEAEAQRTLEAIRSLAQAGVKDPFTHAATLAEAVRRGVLDAPHLQNNPFAPGMIRTTIDGRGACIAVDPHTGSPLTEATRLGRLDL